MKSLKISLFLIDQDSRATAAARRCCWLCPWATWQGFFPSKLIKGDSDVSESCSGKCLAATFVMHVKVYIFIYSICFFQRVDHPFRLFCLFAKPTEVSWGCRRSKKQSIGRKITCSTWLWQLCELCTSCWCCHSINAGCSCNLSDNAGCFFPAPSRDTSWLM